MENCAPVLHRLLNTKNAGGFLPEALSAKLTGTLDNFAGRMARSCSSRVWISMCWADHRLRPDIDEGEYQRLRDAPFGI